VLAESNGENGHEAAPALVGIKKVISGELNLFSLEYPCHSLTEQRWFLMVVKPLNANHKGVVIRHQNITARRLLEAERLENLNLIEKLHREEKLRNKFVGMVPGGFCTYKKGVDGNFSIPFASNGWEDLFEVRASDVVNDATPALQRIHPDDVEFVSSSFGKAMESASNLRIEYKIVTPDKGIIWIEKFGTGIIEEDGSRLFSGFVVNITERKKAEHALTEKLELENQLSRMVNLAPGGFYSFISYPDGSAKMLYSSEKFRRLTQLDVDQASQDFWFTLSTIHEDDIPGVRLSISHAVEATSMWHDEFRIVRPNHTEVWVEGRAQPALHPDGSVHWFGFLADITERKLEEAARKKTEQLLIESEEKYRTLAENSEYPVAAVDGDGTILFANYSFAEIFDRRPEEMVFKKLADAVDPEWADERLAIVRKVIAENRAHIDEMRITNRKGTRWFKRSFRPIAGWNNVSQVLVTGTDITELKNEAEIKQRYLTELENKVQERTLELREALSKDQELLEMKNKFISTTSHEFRTPLSTISLTAGFIRRYHERIDHKTVVDKLNLIEKQVNHMSLLLDDVLMIGRSEAGKLKIAVTQFPLVPFIRSIVDEVEESRKTHKVKTEFSCYVDSISTDEKLIRNIVINLLINAIKFSPLHNTVEFKVSCDDSSFHFVVRDFGIGIPEADLINLFEPFHRGANASQIQGTGLGLSIVKRAIDILGGYISVASTVDEGTTFKVTLPIHTLSEPMNI
jgi:PAS domain S-box-containing protein